MRQFTPTQLHEYLTQADSPPLLLDVREDWEYELCHLQNSVWIPMGQIPNRVEELDPQRETVVICHHGIRSRQVALYLMHMGFENLINLQGGVEAWAVEIDPTMARY